jgi:hypothetical protein
MRGWASAPRWASTIRNLVVPTAPVAVFQRHGLIARVQIVVAETVFGGKRIGPLGSRWYRLALRR